MKKYDLVVYMGRFQPFHLGHRFALDHALEIGDHVLVLLGSSGVPRSPKNPFTYAERRGMIYQAMGITERISYDSLQDSYSDNIWIEQVQEAVAHKLSVLNLTKAKVALVGHLKDDSSYYLKIFPQWDFVDTGAAGALVMDATAIRAFFYGGNFHYLAGAVPETVAKYLRNWKDAFHQEYELLREEHKAIIDYKKSWSVAPFPPTFVTVDAVVIQSGHVLVVKRGHSPGYGQWALPGGFIDENETLQDAMLRELDEETSIHLQRDQLVRSIQGSRVFDQPGRSARGRTITHAYLLRLNDTKPFPSTKPQPKEILETKWMPFSEYAISRELFFEDHWDIIDVMKEMQ